MDLARTATAYRKLIDKKEEITREYKAQIKEIDEVLDQLGDQIQRFMADNGLDKLTMEDITFTAKEKVFPKVEDWDALFQFVAETDMFGLLKKGVKASEVANYLEETGELPPGVTIERAHKLSYRRK